VSALLGTLALALVAALVFACATSLGVAALWPLGRRRLGRTHPALRARGAWLAAVAPAALPALLVGLCFAPGLLGALGLGADHCPRHLDHPHLCLRHASVPLTGAGAALLGAGAALGAAALGSELRRVARARRWLARTPRRAAEGGSDVEVLDSELPWSFTAGLWRPRVHLASGLLAALPQPLLAAVLEHERAHARRRDPLLRITARALSWAHLPRLRRALLAELALASEQACDAEAGRRTGDRLAVAEAILAVERLLAGAPAPAGVSAFGGSSVPERVHALLAAEPPVARRAQARWGTALALGAALALADPLHHATEHLLSLVARWL
jgi:Zn-dependent protease with chaperone function